MNKNCLLIFILVLFALLGCAVMIGGTALFIHNYQFMTNAEEVTATIEHIEKYRDDDGEYDHDVYLGYSLYGRDYDSVILGEWFFTMHEG